MAVQLRELHSKLQRNESRPTWLKLPMSRLIAIDDHLERRGILPNQHTQRMNLTRMISTALNHAEIQQKTAKTRQEQQTILFQILEKTEQEIAGYESWVKAENDKAQQQQKQKIPEEPKKKQEEIEPDYYQILGIPRNASERDIEIAFMRFARHNNSSDPNAQAKYDKAREAYENLRNTKQRASYDARNPHAGQQSGQRPEPGSRSESTPAPASSQPDLYKALGVSRNATRADIKRAYVRLALKNHPDKHPASEQSKWSDKMKPINEAYSTLADSDSRATYDRNNPSHGKSSNENKTESKTNEQTSSSSSSASSAPTP